MSFETERTCYGIHFSSHVLALGDLYCILAVAVPLAVFKGCFVEVWVTKDQETIGHFTVVCLVNWALIGSKAGGDLVLIQTSVRDTEGAFLWENPNPDF